MEQLLLCAIRAAERPALRNNQAARRSADDAREMLRALRGMMTWDEALDRTHEIQHEEAR